jgi:hypothetical protein
VIVKKDTYDDLFDRPDGEEGDRMHTVSCSRCGNTDVRWRLQGGRWTLFSSKPGVEHACVPTTDGFSTEEGD